MTISRQNKAFIRHTLELGFEKLFITPRNIATRLQGETKFNEGVSQVTHHQRLKKQHPETLTKPFAGCIELEQLFMNNAKSA